MAYTVTAEQIASLAPSVKGSDALADAINATAAYYHISDSALRMRYFIAQSCFETLNYSFWSENLMYTTPERLCAVWPSRFSMQNVAGKAYAPDYTGSPSKLANLVYANRGGNGNEASGDGFAFRGRGAFHLTFRSNYAAYSKARYGDDRIVQNPDLVASPQDAFMSAGWFWSTNNLSALADSDSYTKVTQVINGSTATVPQRLVTLNKVNSIFTL
jgi:putative chitinase